MGFIRKGRVYPSRSWRCLLMRQKLGLLFKTEIWNLLSARFVLMVHKAENGFAETQPPAILTLLAYVFIAKL